MGVFILIGFALALAAIAGLIANKQRRRERLSDLLLRFEQLVERDQRLHVRHLTRMSESLFYAHHLLHPLDRAVAILEQQKGIPVGGAQDTEDRFSFLYERQLSSMTARIEALEALDALKRQAVPAPADPPAPPTD